MPHLRPLTGFWIRLSLNKYSLTCRVTFHYVSYGTYSETCLLSKIQTHSGIFRSYSNIFSHIVAYLEPCYVQNPGIVRTQNIFTNLSRHILEYSKPCHIQKLAIFKISAYLGSKTYSESCFFSHNQAYSGIFNDDSYNNINFFLSLTLHTFQRNLKRQSLLK